jgi:hypothetical protein
MPGLTPVILCALTGAVDAEDGGAFTALPRRCFEVEAGAWVWCDDEDDEEGDEDDGGVDNVMNEGVDEG